MGQVPGEEGVPVETTQLKETKSQKAEDAKPDETPYAGDWWGQTREEENGWGSDLQELSSIPQTCSASHPAEAEKILLSSDRRMTLVLRDFLGAGSYGKVLSADWVEDGRRPIAVKVSHKLFISENDWADRGLNRLQDELAILKALKESRDYRELGSNFFPDSLKSWQDAKNVYFVMERYHCNLEELRFADPAWDAPVGDKLLWTAEMVCLHISFCPPLAHTSWQILGVQALHRMRILHRDIKPANIFLTSDKHIVIGDYGLAHAWLDEYYHAFPSSSLRARDSPGTLGYLAPEVVRGFYEDPEHAEVRRYASCSFEADIWSLGVTICESWSPSIGLFGLEEEESHLEPKRIVPRRILESDILPAVRRIVLEHPIWHLVMKVGVHSFLQADSGNNRRCADARQG